MAVLPHLPTKRPMTTRSRCAGWWNSSNICASHRSWCRAARSAARPMTMNLRIDDSFVQDDGWYRAMNRYREFLERNGSSRILYLELGVGFNTPASSSIRSGA